MAYDLRLAERVATYLNRYLHKNYMQKKMFGGLAFMIDDKLCICVSGIRLMCRFAPEMTETLSQRNGYVPMVMRGKEMKGYCYVNPEGIDTEIDFAFWMDLCIHYNNSAKSSKK